METNQNNNQQNNQNYDDKKSEEKWLKYWEENKTYKFNPDTTKEIFSIDTPPPTVSGKMHIGHAFSFSQQDFIARYKRMQGYEVFQPFGTDDNGLPTDKLVEKTAKVSSRNMERKAYIKLCLETLDKLRPAFVADWKRIGMSCDFDIFYSTINEHCQRISQRSYIELYENGREYRKEAPTLWCPSCHQAIAQVELEDKELDSTFNDIIFKLPDGNDLIVSTTRPEMLGACVAIFYNPNDERYKKYDGLKAKVPLFNHEVTILADEKADMEKGTGVVMCCTFGDQTDMEWYQKHKLPLRALLTPDGKMTKLAGIYEGLAIKDARKKIIEDLKTNGLLIKQKAIKHNVNVHERCGNEIEILNSKQWFLKYLDLKEDMQNWGDSLNWYPNHMKNRYDNWVKGLQWDWCLSRQRHFGVPIPVWYCKNCDEIILPKKENLPVDPLIDKAPVDKCPKCNHHEFTPEKDILDTWATSALTPHLACELFKDHKVYEKIYPMNLRPQAHDIITFWLFNTVIKSNLHDKTNPWNDVMISGWALDPHGKKMSKSKGNVVDPEEVLKKFSADALRFWAAGSKLGEDMPYQEKDLQTGKKMITKLWNASKLTIENIKDYDGKKPETLAPIDAWLISKLNKVVMSSTESMDKYEYSKTKQETEKFFFLVFCDNYLEIVKDRLYNPQNYSDDEVLSAKYSLYTSLLSVLKLMAPIMPFITEEVYHMHFAKIEGESSIHNASWPSYNEDLIDLLAEKRGEMACEIISLARKYKSENKLSLKEELSELVISSNDEDKTLLEAVLNEIKATARAKKITFTTTSNESAKKCENFEIKVEIIK